MCRIAQDTVALYASLELDGEPGWYGVGGLEVATTPERMRELHRRRGWATSYGIDDTEILTPAETAERIPLLDPTTVLGSYLVPSDGIAKAVRLAAAMAKRAEANGVAFEGGVTVTGFDTREGRVRGVQTDRGDIECERVLLCAGIWGPSVGTLAGVPIPLVAVQHQLVWTDSIPELAGETREVVHPILRHQDHAMYFRQVADGYAIGNYRHEPRLADPERPAELAFTPEDFASARAEAGRLLPALRDVELTRAFNGLMSFTPDGFPLLGESAAARGLWLAQAIWVTHSAGCGRALAELMTHGDALLDLHECDPERFDAHGTSTSYVRLRGAQGYREVYDVLHPRQQNEQARGLRTTPFYERQLALGAEFFESAAGSGRSGTRPTASS
jgi:glycine/D-amino acid oxidase-like deaminating enzyme